MSPIMRLALPVLAVAGSAYAACSASKTTTIQNSGDATEIASCKTFKGDIAIQTDAPGPIALDGVEKLDGSLVIRNNTQLKELSADSLEEITGDFEMTDVLALNSLSFPSLKSVNAFRWLTLPNLLNMGFDARVTKASIVRIENTQLQSLDGIDIETVDTMFIANNRFINTISMQLTNISDSLILTANNPDVVVTFDNLIAANNMTFRNCSSVQVKSLEELDDSLSLIGNTFTEFHAPNLTKVGGALAINSNFELNNLTFVALTEVGANFEVQNNTKLRKLDGFPELETITADLDLFGNMTKIELPALNRVGGTFNIQSTGDIKSTCEDQFDELKDKERIKGEYFCEGKLEDPGELGSTPKNGDKNEDKEGAAPAIGVEGSALLVGLAAAFFL